MFFFFKQFSLIYLPTLMLPIVGSTNFGFRMEMTRMMCQTEQIPEQQSSGIVLSNSLSGSVAESCWLALLPCVHACRAVRVQKA